MRSVVFATLLGLATALPAHAASCDMEKMSPQAFGKCMLDKITRLPTDGTPTNVGMQHINRLYGCVQQTPDGGTTAQVFMPDAHKMVRHHAALVRCREGQLEVKWLGTDKWE